MMGVLKNLLLSLSLVSSLAAAADRADEYAPISRLTENYQVNDRRQNYDAFSFPVSINTTRSVEGDKTQLEYGYKNSTVNASRLQFQRHFERLVGQIGGEIVYAGQSDNYRYGVTFRFPQKGRTAWALASTNDSSEVYHYRLMIIETNEAWGGAAASAPAPKAAPKFVAADPEPVAVAPVAPTPVAQPMPEKKGAPAVTVDDLVEVGMEYILSEYALDMLQYTSCAMTVAKIHPDANFDKVKRAFIKVFPKEEQKDLELFFYGDDMARLKAKLFERGIIQEINKAKKQGSNMNAYCGALVAKLVEWNEEADANWRRIKLRAARQ